ncbi:hypothetical protein ACTJKN_05165 [Pedobacter sp. 22163]|uniref:hypothetical protein n=1 Tax=Pedobacter sp. 22163 TaxID=3453883 RepID=UPI003F83D0B1
MFSTLTHKPVIGILSGLGSGVILSVQNFFTDETTLKLVGAFGVWAGAIVAILTVWLKVIEYFDKRAIKKERKKLRQIKYENLKQD